MAGRKTPWYTAVALLLSLILLPGESVAQLNSMRVIDRALDINTRNAIERLQLKLKVSGSAGKVVIQKTSRNGRYLLLVFEDNRPRVWDLDRSRYWDQFQAMDAPIVGAAIGGDMRFYTLQNDGSVARWSANSGEPESVEPTSLTGITLAELGRRGELIIVDDEGLVHAFAESLERLGTAYANLPVASTAMALDPSGDVLATAVYDFSLRLWSSRTGAPIADVAVNEGIDAYTFGEESSQLLIATEGAVIDWDTRTSKRKREYRCPGPCVIDKLLVNPATQSLIGLTDGGELLRWSLRNGRVSKDPISSATDLAGLSTTAAAPLLIGGTTRGLVQFSHLERPGSELTLVSTSRGWAMIDALGRFDGQAGAENGVSWGDDNVDFPLPSFVDTHFEPGLFRTWLRSGRDYLTDPKSLSEGVLAPPKVELMLFPPAAGDPQQLIEVQVKVTDQGGGLGTPSLYHLGLRVGADKLVESSSAVEGDRKVAMSTWRVRALPGENTFTARVRDDDGVVSPARVDSVQVDGETRDPNLHLLTLAIDDYGDEDLNLNYSIADATAIVDSLTALAGPLFSEVRTTKVRNEEATRESVIEAIRGLRTANPEDVIVIYAATHGEVIDDKFHLLLQGLRIPLSKRRARSVGIAFDEIAAELEKLDARRVILLLDTCKSGDALAELQNDFRDRRALQSFSNLLGIHMIAATAKGQLATESSVLGHGVFTYSIIEGLKGRADNSPADGLLTAAELARFAESGVPALSAQYAAFPQWPTIYSRGFDFSVAAPLAVEGKGAP